MTPIHEPVDFFMVWTKRGYAPRVMHRDRITAEAEAIRLARKRPGNKYIVLQAINKIHVPGPEPTGAQSL